MFLGSLYGVQYAPRSDCSHLLLMYCLMYFPLCVGILRLSLCCYALRYVHSRFAIIFEEEKAGCSSIIVLQMYFYYTCSAALPHDAVDWTAVCDSDIF